ncbi:MAG: GNAT family N-acetyltransferase [Aggregatilineales bacterium]
MTICYETERLQVRHLTPDDVDDLTALCSDPVAMQYMDDGSVMTREECAGWIDVCQGKYANRGYGTSGVFERKTGNFIGICGVVRPPENEFDEIIYAFNQPYWGKGYATEASSAMLDYVFGISELDEIYATITPENIASQKIMPKIGMSFVEDRPNEDGTVTRVYVIRRKKAE